MRESASGWLKTHSAVLSFLSLAAKQQLSIVLMRRFQAFVCFLHKHKMALKAINLNDSPAMLVFGAGSSIRLLF